MKRYIRRHLKVWTLAVIVSAPIAAIMTYGEWSVTGDMLTLNLPWWYWAYTITSGLALAYFQIRYFDKPKD